MGRGWGGGVDDRNKTNSGPTITEQFYSGRSHKRWELQVKMQKKRTWQENQWTKVSFKNKQRSTVTTTASWQQEQTGKMQKVVKQRQWNHWERKIRKERCRQDYEEKEAKGALQEKATTKNPQRPTVVGCGFLLRSHVAHATRKAEPRSSSSFIPQQPT